MARTSQATNLAAALEGGITKSAGWLFEQLATEVERKDWLKKYFPNMRSPSRNAVYNTMQSSYEAAQHFATERELPAKGTVPRDPSIEDRDTYQYVVRYGYEGTANYGTPEATASKSILTLVIDAGGDITPEGLQELAEDAYLQLMEDEEKDYPNPNDFRVERIEFNVTSITRG